MAILIILPCLVLIVVVSGVILMRPMKVIQLVVPWTVVVASVLVFALGWAWDMRGNGINGYVNDSTIMAIDRAVSNFGTIIECIGILGALVGLSLIGAKWYFGAIKKQISRLEAEVDYLRLCLSARQQGEEDFERLLAIVPHSNVRCGRSQHPRSPVA